MSKILSCPKCDFETVESLAKCPKCGRRLQSAKKVRILGWLLVVLGGFLVIFMGGLGIYLAGIIAETGQPGKTSRFTGGGGVRPWAPRACGDDDIATKVSDGITTGAH